MAPAEGYRRYKGSPLLTMQGIRLVTGYAAMVPDRVLKLPIHLKQDRQRDRLNQLLRVGSWISAAALGLLLLGYGVPTLRSLRRNTR